MQHAVFSLRGMQIMYDIGTADAGLAKGAAPQVVLPGGGGAWPLQSCLKSGVALKLRCST